MINEICKLHSISWKEAEQYTMVQYYKICAFQEIENLNLKKDNE